MIKNIIFDWAGTLCDDFEMTYRCNSYIHEALGHPPMTREEFALAFELPIAKYNAKMYPAVATQIIDNLYFEACRKFDFLNGRVAALKNARSILSRLKACGYALYVFSSTNRPTLMKQLKALQMGHCFQWVTGGVSDKVAQLPEFLRLHNLIPYETIYVGDLPHDIAAGLNAGCHTAAVLTGYGTEESLCAARPHVVLDNLEYLPNYIADTNFLPPPSKKAERKSILSSHPRKSFAQMEFSFIAG